MVRKSINIEKSLEIIHLKHHTLQSYVKIAQLVGVSEKCVRTTLKNYSSINTTSENKKYGRPRKLSLKAENYIFRKARVHVTWSNRDLANDINSIHCNITVSRDTIRRILKRRGIGSYIAARKPLLTVKDRLKRLNW